MCLGMVLVWKLFPALLEVENLNANITENGCGHLSGRTNGSIDTLIGKLRNVEANFWSRLGRSATHCKHLLLNSPCEFQIVNRLASFSCKCRHTPLPNNYSRLHYAQTTIAYSTKHSQMARRLNQQVGASSGEGSGESRLG